jgi:hypothetical protein
MLYVVSFWLKHNFVHIITYISYHSANQKYPENTHTSLPQQNGTQKQGLYRNAQHIFADFKIILKIIQLDSLKMNFRTYKPCLP